MGSSVANQDALCQPLPLHPRILVAIFAYNEGTKIRRTIARHPQERPYDLLLMDDGTTDGSLEGLPPDVKMLRHPSNRGIGAAMKTVFEFAMEQGYDVLVMQAGNDKDNPLEIPALLQPIQAGEADFVQGSRYLETGRHRNMPLYRVFTTRYVHPVLFSMALRRRFTDTTNGFRAFRTAILKDPRINWRQEWLDRYELEPYVLYWTVRLGYRHREVPVTKVYPPRAEGYTKMRPITGWWSILRPIFYLWFGLKK